MTYSNRVRKVVATTSLALAVAGFTGACGIGEEDEQVYCVDEFDNVVDDDECDTGGGGGGFFVFVSGGNSYSAGQRIPKSSYSNRISALDSAARTKAGLPAKGLVKSGSVVRGGIGSGSLGKSGGG